MKPVKLPICANQRADAGLYRNSWWFRTSRSGRPRRMTRCRRVVSGCPSWWRRRRSSLEKGGRMVCGRGKAPGVDMSVDAAGTSARATEKLRGVVAGAGLYYQDFLLLFGGEVNEIGR